MSCPGQYSHQFLTIALAAFHSQLKAPREQAPPEETGESQRSGSEQSQAAPRELRRDAQAKLPPQVPQISENLLETTLKSQNLPGRWKLKGMARKPREKQGGNAEEPEERKAPAGIGPASQAILGPPRAKSMGRKGPRNPPREGMPFTHQRDRSMGRAGPRIRPRDDDVGGHPADSPPGSRQRMSGHAVGWFLRNMERAFANMDDGQLNRVSETLNHEMDQRGRRRRCTWTPPGRQKPESSRTRQIPTSPRGRTGSRWRTANEPGSRARSRSKAVTRRRAQWRADHGLPPREEEWAAAAAAAAAGEEEEDEEVEIGQADFSTDSPPRGAGRWRHGGDKSQHVPRGSEPDLPVTQDLPGSRASRRRTAKSDWRWWGARHSECAGPALAEQPMSRLRDCLGMHDRALPARVMKTLRELIEKRPKNVSFSEDNGYWMPSGSRIGCEDLSPG